MTHLSLDLDISSGSTMSPSAQGLRAARAQPKNPYARNRNRTRVPGEPGSDITPALVSRVSGLFERAPPAPSQRKWDGCMPSAELRGVTLDCDDPQSLARFYQELTGMTVGFSSEGYVALTGGPGTAIGFQRVENYRAPQWPDQQLPQQLQLDFAVEDLDAPKIWCCPWARLDPSINRAGTLPRPSRPAGHPFCLLAA